MADETLTTPEELREKVKWLRREAYDLPELARLLERAADELENAQQAIIDLTPD